MTHAELVAVATRWLWRKRRCHVVLSEVADHFEVPDAIGWETMTNTILVECKTSRSDFLRDAKKSFRRTPSEGMGLERYYCAPAGMLSPEELPEGWGLLEVGATGRVRLARKSLGHDRNVDAERRLVFWELSRFARGFRRGPDADPKYGRPLARRD